MKFKTSQTALLVAMVLVSCWAGQAQATTINILERESQATLGLSVVSLAAGDTGGDSDTSTASTGSFAFTNTDSVDVTTGAGSATASGSLTVADSVSQPNASSLLVLAERSASISATASQGSTSTGSSAQALNSVRVRFDVIGDDVDYLLTGFFDPGGDNPNTIFDYGSIQLYRPNTSFMPINITTAGPVNEMGTLPGGLTYELLIQVNDLASAGGATLSQSDASSFNLTFTVVPEPASAVLLGIAAVLLFVCRRRIYS